MIFLSKKVFWIQFQLSLSRRKYARVALGLLALLHVFLGPDSDFNKHVKVRVRVAQQGIVHDLTPSPGIIGYVFRPGISQSDSLLHDRART